MHAAVGHENDIRERCPRSLTISSTSTQVFSRYGYADRLLGCRHLPSHRRMPEVGCAPCDTGCDIRLPSQTPSRRLNRLHMLEPT